eukprot:scaffold44608_cov87-Cyclotella_meneghiniana.AAC.10
MSEVWFRMVYDREWQKEEERRVKEANEMRIIHLVYSGNQPTDDERADQTFMTAYDKEYAKKLAEDATKQSKAEERRVKEANEMRIIHLVYSGNQPTDDERADQTFMTAYRKEYAKKLAEDATKQSKEEERRIKEAERTTFKARLKEAKQAKVIRQGKWTPEELAYANRLIVEFKRGTLPLSPNITLREFLSRTLRCDHMRITKKFGSSNWGVYRPSSNTVHDADTMTAVSKEVKELEHAFLRSIGCLEYKEKSQTAKFWKDTNGIIAASANQNANQMPSANQQNTRQTNSRIPQQSERQRQAVVPPLPININSSVPRPPSRKVVANPYKKAQQQKRKSNQIESHPSNHVAQNSTNAAMPSLPNANPRVPPHQVAGNQPICNPYSIMQQQQQLYAFPQQYYAYPPVMMPPNMQGQPVMRNNTGNDEKYDNEYATT